MKIADAGCKYRALPIYIPQGKLHPRTQEPTMAHDNHDSHELPIIPFTATEQAVMEADDGKAAKIIASLTTGIFLVGIVLYVTVMVSVLARDPIYSIR